MPSAENQPLSPQQSPAKNSLERIVENYGDLMFDLCESILWNPANAQLAFRAILKEMKKRISLSRTSSSGYEHYERAWVLKVTCGQLEEISSSMGRKVTASEQIQLDSNPQVSSRLKQFDYFFHRLRVDEQILLLLRDKYGIPYTEIAAALEAPEGTLKLKRQQALRTLEEWIWEAT